MHQGDHPGFHLGISRTRSDAFLVVRASTWTTSESHLLPGDDPDAPLTLVAKRTEGVDHTLHHHEDRLFIRTNHRVADFEVMTAPASDPGPAYWTPFITPPPHQPMARRDEHSAVTEDSGHAAEVRVEGVRPSLPVLP